LLLVEAVYDKMLNPTDQKVRGSNPFGRAQFGPRKRVTRSSSYPTGAVGVLAMTTRKRETADVTGIRQRGERFQVRIPAASTRPPASS